jgi:hypothetical protein
MTRLPAKKMPGAFARPRPKEKLMRTTQLLQQPPIGRNSGAMTPDLRTIARTLDGEISGNCVRAPGPGHSRKDRSLAIEI